jgi:hypothetical protein
MQVTSEVKCPECAAVRRLADFGRLGNTAGYTLCRNYETLKEGTGAHPRELGAAAPPQIEIKKNRFCRNDYTKYLPDFPFCRNQLMNINSEF